MKLSLSWLESYFVTKPDWNIIWDKLTMAGIEVEGIEHVAPPFSGIVVAEVIECEKHPEADKLSKCLVDAGTGELLQIICGASNVKAGIKIPCAKVGAVLPDGLEIAERKMRGLTSFGMLCSGNEIACPDGVDGLLVLPNDAPIGTSIRDYMGLDDQIVEFKITPNRSDCLSIRGLLREIVALTGEKVYPIESKQLDTSIDEQVKVIMQASEQCPNYMALIIKDIDNSAQLPEQMLRRLTRSGLRSISPVVDITNYVMLELGQPLHAFDLNKVGNQLQIRMATDGESIKLLDGRVASLKDNTLIICDSKNQAIAIAGVMGGFDSGVNAETTALVLESAYFTPNTIAGRAKQYGVNSDSAYRYERGVDFQLQAKAQMYAAELITKYCGGKVGVVSHVESAKSAVPHSITISYDEINRLIGTVIGKSEVDGILSSLGFLLNSSNADVSVIAPSYRFDIAIKEDIVEEVARIYGYDNIPAIMPVASYTIAAPDAVQLATNCLKDCLLNSGYNEIVSYAFIEDKFEEMLGKTDVKVVKLLNPIAGLNVMRTSLVADLVKALMSNLNRGHKNIKLFELARVFHGEDIQTQPLRLSGLVYGSYQVAAWANSNKAVDFFDVKNDVSLLLEGLPDIQFEAENNNNVFHGGRCARILSANKEIGIIGQLHPKLGQELGLIDLPYLFELDLIALTDKSVVPCIHELSKFQKVERDLAFVLASNVAVGKIIDAIENAHIDYLIDMTVFDVYQGANLGSGSKSVAINFVFHEQKTLVEDEINSSIAKIVELVTTGFNAQLRQ